MPHAWYNTAFTGEIIGRHIKGLERRSKRIEKHLNHAELGKVHLTQKEIQHLESKHERLEGQLAFLTNTMTGIQKLRLAEREFDEWQRTLDDIKQKGGDPKLLAQSIQR